MNIPSPVPAPAQFVQYDISPATVEAAARLRYGNAVQVSAPYWVDSESIRVGLFLDEGGMNCSFGANYRFKEGRFP